MFNREPKYSREDFIIKWADALIQEADKGILDKYCFSLTWSKDYTSQNKFKKFRDIVIKQINSADGKLDKYITSFNSYSIDTETFLLKEGYIKKESPNFDWVLTDKGKLVQELGGHYKYKKYRIRELNILKHQNTVNTLLITIAFLSVIVPIFIAYFSTNKTIVINNTKGKYELKQVAPDTLLLTPVLEGKDTVTHISAGSLK